MRLTHVGGNFLGLRDKIDSWLEYESRVLVSNPHYDIGSVSVSLNMGHMEYIRVSSDDVRDRQIMFTGRNFTIIGVFV